LKENNSEADQRLAKFGDATDVKWQLLTALHYRLQSKIEAIQVLSVLPETPEVLLELGKCNFGVHKLDAALINVLKATKQEPHNSECFYWLGKIYLASADESRAKKCFEKCLNLNPQNEQAIVQLSTIYRKNGEWDSNLTLLENSVRSVEGQSDTKFAYLQLGLHHLSRRNFDDVRIQYFNHQVLQFILKLHRFLL
jgi:superkiller protein 3